MYYEEKVINGILCWRGDPHGEWHEMDYVELLNHYEVEKRQHYDYFQLAQERQNEAESLTASRDAWKKVAELLGSNIVLKFDYDCFGDPIALRCPICHKKSGMADRGADGDHKPNCPIEQLRKMKEGEG